MTPRVVLLAISGVLNIVLLAVISGLLDRIEAERKLFNDTLRKAGLK